MKRFLTVVLGFSWVLSFAQQYPDLHLNDIITLTDQKAIGVNKLSDLEKDNLRVLLIEQYKAGYEAGKKEGIQLLMNGSNHPNSDLLGLTVFPEKGECITKNEIKVFQVLKPNMALSETGKYPDQIMVLLINYDGKSYYDDQKIEIPANKCARQIGIFQYTNNMGSDKTIPAVVIE